MTSWCPALWRKLPLSLLIAANAGVAAENIEEVRVVAPSPVRGLTPDMMRLPFAIQRATAEQLDESLAIDLTDFSNSKLGSVSINSAQNNPLQPDLQFRGFTASPLLGLPQGMAVYQNGARLNEPLGDSVSWDLIPLSAVNEMTLISGANPIFGLNTLGGAITLEMKNGFNFQGTQLEVSSGSWDRQRGSLEHGWNNGVWGLYVNLNGMQEDGWRDLSESNTWGGLATVSWRQDDLSAVNLTLQSGRSDLTGNGASPTALLDIDRAAIFTAPDITENDMRMVTLDGFHFFSDSVQFAGSAFYRAIDTDSFNGDGSDLEECTFAGGQQALLDEAEEQEDALEDLGIDLDDICDGGVDTVTSFDDLEELIEARAEAAGLDPEEFELEDISQDLPAGAEWSDEAINNISSRDQESYGFDSQVTFLNELFGYDNSLVVGIGYLKGESDFTSVTELSDIDPVTRSTAGLGTGTFLDDQAVEVATENETSSLYIADTLRLSDALTMTIAGRFNRTDVTLRDQSGERPELNGDHRFSRFNPSVGLNYQAASEQFYYASYSESSRAPTPIELSCNEGVFEVARQFAEARGDDPDDIDFECRLPNAFLADPPLQQVVAKSFEVGTRGVWKSMNYTLGGFVTRNRDDILFQSTGRSTGLFANVDATKRQGIEFSLAGDVGALDWSLHYAWVDATFDSSLAVLSPNHPDADDAGEIQVSKGDRIPGIPDHQLKFSTGYRFTDALYASIDILANSSQVLRGDESNQMDEVDGYGIVDLNAWYQLTEQLSIFLQVDNVFDTEYENFGLLGEDPGEAIDALEGTSPVFLGAGAPRGAWVGVKLRF